MQVPRTNHVNVDHVLARRAIGRYKGEIIWVHPLFGLEYQGLNTSQPVLFLWCSIVFQDWYKYVYVVSSDLKYTFIME